MKIDITSLCFGFKIDKDNDSGTAAWATSIGQAPKGICYIDTKREGLDEIIYGMMYKSHSDFENLKVRDVEGLEKREEPRGERERMLFSVFENVYVNNIKVNGLYTLSYEREDTPSHKNRLHICYAKYLTYKGHSNKMTLMEMAKALGCGEDACWFVSDISIRNQKDLYFTAIVVNPDHSMTYVDSKVRKKAWESLLPEKPEIGFDDIGLPLQQIFYGAPGTGKSHEIKKLTKGESVIRTTFHPDSDYSTFVGCYKPTMDEVDTQVVPVVVKSGISLQEPGTYKEKRITYKFVMQAFLKAYLGAWKKLADAEDENVAPQFLIIEEINRGNCAQIFGDLFQLLDRSDNNFSEYPIEADTDLQKEIERAFKEHKDYKLINAINVEGAVKDYISNYDSTLSEDIQSGRILLLPPNLYILATMNTSDQSLFPIDSAFKRRWEWRYIKIAEGRDEETRELLNWTVKFDYKEGDKPFTFECSWWEFIKDINEKIAEATSSDDKKLGYFFCKPKDKNSKTIDEERFVGKVVFYLWNDVFKDEENPIFKVNEGKGEPSFDAFYKEDEVGKTVVDTSALRKFMHNVFGEGDSRYIETAKSEA